MSDITEKIKPYKHFQIIDDTRRISFDIRFYRNNGENLIAMVQSNIDTGRPLKGRIVQVNATQLNNYVKKLPYLAAKNGYSLRRF